MAYEFHYTPTGTGVISGKEVLEQTEDAINDLGNTAISGVQEALDKAEQALTNSENAVDDAQTALNTANNAEGVAIQAQNDVSNLSGTVTNIGNRVTTDEGNITDIQGRMTTAEGNITNIQGRMTTAEGNIGNLQTAVSTAQATANSAQQTATTARQQSYVFRYSSTALVASSTNSNALLDNTDNLKVGDKVLDSSGNIYVVTAIDTANSTFTIGTALIDLAQDSDVVHTSGNETVGGEKTFTSSIKGYNSDSTQSTVSIDLRTSKVSRGNTSDGVDTFGFGFRDKNNSTLASISCVKRSTGGISEYHTVNTTDSSDNVLSESYSFNLSKDGNSTFRPETNDKTLLGTSTNNWKGVYATNYYYGANNVEFSSKFVTTDTNQTINGNKTFNGDTRCVGELNQTAPFKMTADTSFVIGSKNTSIYDQNGFQCSNELITYNNSKNIRRSWTLYNNGSGTSVTGGFNFILAASGQKVFYPITDSDTDNGSSTAYWKSTYTKKVNGVEPSSLSLPSGNASDVIDISSYITALNGTFNSYTVPANGWISIAVVGTAIAIVSSSWSDSRLRESSGNVRMLYPVLKNETLNISVVCTTLVYARFIPCQGNI